METVVLFKAIKSDTVAEEAFDMAFDDCIGLRFWSMNTHDSLAE